MIKIDFHKGELVGVLGLGATGLSVVASCLAGEAEVIGWDDNKQTRKRAAQLYPALTLLPPEADAWRGVQLFVPSPGVSEKHDLIKDLTLLKIKTTGDVELFARAIKGSGVKTIAITGTNGKSTTTAFIGQVLSDGGYSVAIGGNIGVPVLALEPPCKGLIYVLEISSYQASRLKIFAPTIAAQLNLTPDHTARHGSLEKYAAAKAKLFAGLGKSHLALINTGDKFGKKLYDSVKARKIEINKTRLPKGLHLGHHRKENIAAAFEVARYFKISNKQFIDSFNRFKPLAHRQEVIAEIDGVPFINDSKATNADAASLALSQYQDIHWLAGGAAKAEGFGALEKTLGHIHHAYLFGSAAPELSAFLRGRVSQTSYPTLEDAVRAVLEKAKRGVVLLSPACASFDSYRDFAERGRAFGSYVRRHSSPKVIIAAGGTGGGIFPAEGLAQSLRHKGKEAHLFYDKRAKTYKDSGVWDGLRQISSAAMAGRSALGLLAASFFMAWGVVQSLYGLTRIRGQKVIVGFGGYPSVPVVLAGFLLRLPIVLHEPGGVLGRANKFLKPFARRLSLSQRLRGGVDKSILIGNPVRPRLLEAGVRAYVAPKKGEAFRIFIFAGSQGSEWFDKNLPLALRLLARKHKISVVQQCRSREQEIKQMYDEAGTAHRLASFFDNIEKHITESHLVIARGGASTISELKLFGRPAIVIPISDAGAFAEQTANAKHFVETGAGWLMHEREFLPEKLARRLAELIESPNVLLKAARSSTASSGEAGSQAGDRLAQLVLSEAGDV